MEGSFELIPFQQNWGRITDSFKSSLFFKFNYCSNRRIITSSKSSFSHFSYFNPQIIACMPRSYSFAIKSNAYATGIKSDSFKSKIFLKLNAHGVGSSDNHIENDKDCAGGSGGAKNGGDLFDNFGDWFWNDNRSSSAYGRIFLFGLLLFFCLSRHSSYKGHLYSILSYFALFTRRIAAARVIDPTATNSGNINKEEEVWEVKGGKRTRLVPTDHDEFTVGTTMASSPSSPQSDSYVFASDHSSSSASTPLSYSAIFTPPWLWLSDFMAFLLLPEGFPRSVSTDYVDYCVWRGVQSVASQISSVISTQALLYALGLGKGQITTAAAVNWIIKDGIGYLSKIVLSKYGRHFDVNPKAWRLFADLLENFAYGMEMLTPAFPHLFVFVGAAAGAGRSASALIQAATRNCFYSSFAVRRNFAEVIAKGEAQGMVSKCIGTLLGVLLARCIGSSGPLTAMSFCIVTWIHMFCNLNSYRCIQLRTLNSYRASLIFSEYLLSGQVPSVKEVNAEEPLFSNINIFVESSPKMEQSDILSFEARSAAADIDGRLIFGSKLSEVINNFDDAVSLFDLYRNEGYILTESTGKYCVILKEGASQEQMLKSIFQINYMYWLEKQAGMLARGISQDCKAGGRLSVSLEYTEREFRHVKSDGASLGWVTSGLISAPVLTKVVVHL